MKIALAQQNYHIGNFANNTKKIIEAIKQAKQEGADLIVFSELCVCGYPPRDFLEFNDFIEQCEFSVKEIASYCVEIAALIGTPVRNNHSKGKKLHNAALFLENGKVQQEIYKTLLPTYDIFDENRYFEAADSWSVIPFQGVKMAVTICEDIWNIGDNQLYRVSPMDELMGQEPDIMINLSASPFDYTHAEDRKSIIKANVQKYRIPMIYCNAVGSQTELVFDGQSMVFDDNGNMCSQMNSFTEDLQYIEWHKEKGFASAISLPQYQIPERLLEPEQLLPNLNIAAVYDALVLGITDYFTKMGFKKAILGSSGGIDSAVTLALAVAALGKEQVTAVLMPSPYSSDHSVNDAIALSEQLGNPYHVLPINMVNTAMLETLDPFFSGTPFGLAEENIQSRIRGNMLMAIANKQGFILLNTSNKSELSTGYGTLYGDMAGGLGVLGDCYKTQVYALARYINSTKPTIPESIITKAPSAELRPGQKDSDSLPDYEVLDQILYQYIERTQGPNEIKSMGFDSSLTDRILKLVNTNEYKRNQFCPIIRVSSKAFGVGRRMPIVGKYLS